MDRDELLDLLEDVEYLIEFVVGSMHCESTVEDEELLDRVREAHSKIQNHGEGQNIRAKH